MSRGAVVGLALSAALLTGCERRHSRPAPAPEDPVTEDEPTDWDAVVAERAAEGEDRAAEQQREATRTPPPEARDAPAPPDSTAAESGGTDRTAPARRDLSSETAGQADDWYRERGLRHTLFDPNDPAITEAEGRYLRSCVQVMDVGAAVMLSHVPACLDGLCTTVPAARVLRRAARMARTLKPPVSLSGHHGRIAEALEHYAAASDRWATRGDGIKASELRTDPDLRAARSVLDQAQRQVAQALPRMGAHNQASLRDHHRALEVR